MYRAAKDGPDLFRHGNLKQVQAMVGDAYRLKSIKKYRLQASPPEAESIHRVKNAACGKDSP